MTHVKMIYKNNIIIGFRMKGHAGFNTKGPDILCASLSTASQMTINGILDATGFEYDDVVRINNPKEAILDVVLNPNDLDNGLSMGIVVQQLFKTFEMYIEQLAEQYKENVSLERSQKR